MYLIKNEICNKFKSKGRKMAPEFSVNSGAIQGAVWDGKYGLTPSIKKAKRTKEGTYVKDDAGKQVYSDFYNKNDLINVSFVAMELYRYMLNNDVKKEPEAKF